MAEQRHYKAKLPEELDKLLSELEMTNPPEGFADKVMDKITAKGDLQSIYRRWSLREWRNGMIAAAATLLFVAADIPARLAGVDAGQVGLYIQVNVLSALQFGIQLIRLT